MRLFVCTDFSRFFLFSSLKDISAYYITPLLISHLQVTTANYSNIKRNVNWLLYLV